MQDIKVVFEACEILSINVAVTPLQTLTKKIVEKNFKKRSLELHPDKQAERKTNGLPFVTSQEAEAAYKDLNNAKNTLLNYLENPTAYSSHSAPRGFGFFPQENGAEKRGMTVHNLRGILGDKFDALTPEQQDLLVAFCITLDLNLGKGKRLPLNPASHIIYQIVNDTNLSKTFFSNVFGNSNLLNALKKIKLTINRENFLIGLIYANLTDRDLILLLFDPIIFKLFDINSIVNMVENAFARREIDKIRLSILTKKTVTSLVSLEQKVSSLLQAIINLYQNQLLNNLIETNTQKLVVEYCVIKDKHFLHNGLILLKLNAWEYSIYSWDTGNLLRAFSQLASAIPTGQVLNSPNVMNIFTTTGITNYDHGPSKITLAQLYPNLPANSISSLSLLAQKKLQLWLFNQQEFFRHPIILPQFNNFIDALGSYQAISLIESGVIANPGLRGLLTNGYIGLEILAYLSPNPIISLVIKADEYTQLVKNGHITGDDFSGLMQYLQQTIQNAYKEHFRLCKERPEQLADQCLNAVTMTDDILPAIFVMADEELKALLNPSVTNSV